MTQHEVDVLKAFVSAGGTLVATTGNVFCAEVTYNRANGDVQFVRGHGNAFDKATSTTTKGDIFDRWFDDVDLGWFGSSFVRGPWVYDLNTRMGRGRGYRLTFNPVHASPGEDQTVMVTSGTNIILDFGAQWYAPSSSAMPIQFPFPQTLVATYQRPFGAGQSICMGVWLRFSDTTYLSFTDQVIKNVAAVGNMKTTMLI